VQPHLIRVLLDFRKDYATDGEAYINRERFFTLREFLATEQIKAELFKTLFLNQVFGLYI
jgi:hypothetical protein